MGSLIPFNLVGLPSYRSPESSSWTSETRGGGGYSLLWPIRGGPERGTLLRVQVCETVGISLVEIYETVEKSVVSVRKKA